MIVVVVDRFHLAGGEGKRALHRFLRRGRVRLRGGLGCCFLVGIKMNGGGGMEGGLERGNFCLCRWMACWESCVLAGGFCLDG